MREVDFYQLPRHVQERFVTSSRGGGMPSVLLVSKPTPSFPWFWTVMAVAGLTSLLVTSAIGFGTLGHPRAINTPLAILVYAAGAAAALLGALLASARASAHKRLHYPAGHYLYPIGVIDAMTARPRIHPLSDLKEIVVSQPPRTLTLRFADGHSYEFDAQAEARATQIAQQIQRYQLELPNALGDPRELAVLDPLTDSGVPNPLLPTTPLVRQSPAWIRFAVPIALVLGLGLGAGLWLLRNTLSERRMLAAAVQTNTVEGYRAYLTAGGRHSEVANLWLPRAELQRARNQGTVEAIEQFVEQHPNQIQNEVTPVMQEALLAELERAKKTGKVAALRAIPKKYRRHDLIAPQLEAAIHSMYQQALKQFHAKVVDKPADVYAFVWRLVQYSEQHGPTVQVRFQRELSPSMEQMETQVRKSPFATKEHFPAQYFDAAHDAARQAKLGEKLIQRLQQEFPPDILRFETGAELPAGGGAAKVDVPTLKIKQSTLATGAATMNKPRGVFLALSVGFDSSFEIPGDKKPLVMKFRRAAAPDIKAVVDDGLNPEALYTRMTDKCYGDFAKAFLAGWFKQP